MRRREVIAALVGTLAWPSAAAGQQRVPKIGVIVAADPGRFRALLVKALERTSYLEGHNIQVETWSADGDPGRLSALAADLVASRVDVIVAYPTPAAVAAQRATHEIPIVVVATDPVGTALVTSLS